MALAPHSPKNGAGIEETLELVPFFNKICVWMGTNFPSRPKKYESMLKNTFVGFGLTEKFVPSQKSYVWSCNYRLNDQLIKINYRSLKLICSFRWFYALTSHQWIKANSQSFTEKCSFSKYCHKFLKSSREIVNSCTLTFLLTKTFFNQWQQYIFFAFSSSRPKHFLKNLNSIRAVAVCHKLN